MSDSAYLLILLNDRSTGHQCNFCDCCQEKCLDTNKENLSFLVGSS